jgi:hypothetical protein
MALSTHIPSNPRGLLWRHEFIQEMQRLDDFAVQIFCVTQLGIFFIAKLYNALNSSCHHFVLFTLLNISFVDK